MPFVTAATPPLRPDRLLTAPPIFPPTVRRSLNQQPRRRWPEQPARLAQLRPAARSTPRCHRRPPGAVAAVSPAAPGSSGAIRFSPPSAAREGAAEVRPLTEFQAEERPAPVGPAGGYPGRACGVNVELRGRHNLSPCAPWRRAGERRVAVVEHQGVALRVAEVRHVTTAAVDRLAVEGDAARLDARAGPRAHVIDLQGDRHRVGAATRSRAPRLPITAIVMLAVSNSRAAGVSSPRCHRLERRGRARRRRTRAARFEVRARHAHEVHPGDRAHCAPPSESPAS